jgi:altronate dehydratase
VIRTGDVAPRPRALVLHARDNVAVAVAALAPGDELELQGVRVTVREPIPFGHKLALRDVARGAGVVKYGEVIGLATAAIAAGRHVHVQNVCSRRLPGPEVTP